MKRKMVAGLGVLVSVMVVAWVISCGGGGSGGGSGFAGLVKVLDLDSRAEDIPLEAGKIWSLAFSVNLNMERFGGPYTAFNLNFEENLPGLVFSTITTTGLAGVVPLGTETGYMTIYVGPVDAANPCTEGDGVVQYGPYEISFDESDQPESVDPPTDSATQDTIDIINLGAFSVCVEIDSPFDANATQDEATFGACTENIESIAGTWEGTYYCTSSNPICAIDESSISIRVVQSTETPGYANYSEIDGDGFYMGNACGYSFSFEGGGPSWEESGIFIMDEDGVTATKTSYYEDDFGCTGACYDSLTREVDE